ncbi:MAG: hypothetical protein LBC02_05510 [Planctomycetaceae bacterium]|jgi:hypothetical protein|nr:hypothetical protein [Planctomycetaceae bacterium]
MTPVFVLISQKIINRFINIRRPFRALIVVGFTRPVGAGNELKNPIALSGHYEYFMLHEQLQNRQLLFDPFGIAYTKTRIYAINI